jgi:hypothetical protein
MGTYLVMWEIDNSRIPYDPKERIEGWNLLMAGVGQNVENGIVKDWGIFVGEKKGYSIYEATRLDLMKILTQYVPFVKFEVHPAGTFDDVNATLKELSG